MKCFLDFTEKRIDCAKAEEGLKTTPNLECALNAPAIDNPLDMQDCISMELCKCGLMQRTVWNCGNSIGELLGIGSPPKKILKNMSGVSEICVVK